MLKRILLAEESAADAEPSSSYRLGVHAYVVKPVDVGQFTQAIHERGLFWSLVSQPPPGNP